MVKRVGKRGDTLIEVMLAVGIFSMVAVAVVAVMSGGTSSAQTALETTLAREEIDAQAEALRFIQSSYIAEKDDKNGRFAKLWQLITATSTEHASDNVKVVIGEDNINAIAQYSPSECSKLYEDSVNIGEARNYGFVINTRELGIFDDPSQAIIKGSQKNGSKYILDQAATYPRLVYNDGASLVTSDTISTTPQSVEGIYIIAVKDPESTQITNKGDTAAYYDFYIRTCWYGTGDKTPSTISTVMRLYDPGIVNN